MHASLAFVNGAGTADCEGLRLLNTLLSSSTGTEPVRFQNDPDDAKNPNEVRERHLKKVKR